MANAERECLEISLHSSCFGLGLGYSSSNCCGEKKLKQTTEMHLPSKNQQEGRVRVNMFAELLEQNSDCRLARVLFQCCQLLRSHFV